MPAITLIHTNDVHSNLDLWPATAATVKAELARAAAAGRPAAYVDAGDFMEMSDRYCYGTRGDVAPKLLGALGCAAFVPGNNELWRNSLARTTQLVAASPFPWVCCNLRQIPGMRDWVMIHVGPIRIGVVGATALYPFMAGPMGLVQPTRNEAIRRAAGEARRAGAHLVLLLSHMGLRVDRDVATANLGVDLIIGGHTHDELQEPEVVAGVPIAQAGMSGEWVGVLTLQVEGGRLVQTAGRLVRVDPDRLDTDAAALVADVKQQAEAALDEGVTVLSEPLPHDPLGDSRLGETVAEALRRFAGAEVGLATGLVAVQGLSAGPVTRRNLLDTIPSLFAPCLMEGTGAALLTLLEETYCPEIAGRRAMAGGQRSADMAIGRVHSAGLTYTYVPNGRNGRRVVDVRINGAPVEFHRVYRIGAPSYMAFPRAGYPAFAGFREIRTFAPELVREVLEGFLRQGGALTAE